MMCDALRNLVEFGQFKKRENPHGRVLLLVKLQVLKVALLNGCFSAFVNCTSCTKSRKTSHMLVICIGSRLALLFLNNGYVKTLADNFGVFSFFWLLSPFF